MFGESESESPRVPSPWDSLMSASASASTSTSPSPTPKFSRTHTPSPLASELALTSIPRLVPESDDGNVEYKLQLLNPSPARFARLVTQLKWRLLEGGGQAYYELGVADSGDLVGLRREELEQSLETLEMMAGEIGASVIVVKEIEVPAALSKLAAAKRSGDNSRRKDNKSEEELDDDSYNSSSAFNSNSDLDLTDASGLLDGNGGSRDTPPGVFVMDSESETDMPRYTIDLEISSVFKPRPVRTKHSFPNHPLVAGKGKRGKKNKQIQPAPEDKQTKAMNRRQARDRKREEKKKTLMALAAQSVGEVQDIPAPVPVAAEVESVVSTLETLTVAEPEPVPAVVEAPIPTISVIEEPVDNDDDDDDDVFPTTARQPAYPKFASTLTESHLDVDPAAVKLADVS
ncbi:GTP binding protein 2 [Coprinopsis cinerea okayama7|uniref:GTP binding protein 2 n=1 Tax=Coprinopsis cinerea (strain Okayama-7 / 130 / ATCC MYA-4618 / FGSC 9003) TaxID=240176 RepID=A8NLP5_COPC7|nr:GTP binding protein 2 [Coprinopsis cinerea okayama7\|eukprot:XP_001834745.2 GTP binding protein 2 [Coprinopsis cinerea okayama7\